MHRAIDQVGLKPELNVPMMATFTRAAEMTRNQDLTFILISQAL
jgi:truncated hemoglobin YjbI